MTLSVLRTRNILLLVDSSQYHRWWRALFVLMIFFAAGYLAALLLVAVGITTFLVALTGVIFFFGALFVYIVVRVGSLTIKELLVVQHSLEVARDDALVASSLKTELLARVSHELRTPLHAISGYTEILESAVHGPLSDKQREIIDRISVNADELETQINHLLQQAQIEIGELTLEMQPISPSDLLDHVDLTLGPLAAKKGLAIHYKIDEGLAEILLGDYQRLREIVTNLVSNAIKFSDEGHVGVRLFQPDAGYWAIEVTDSGPGIPASVLPKIFEPFQQGDGSSTRLFGGTGLGLSIVKQMTELMSGEIVVESDEGRGSVFTVIFPLLSVQGAKVD